MLSILRKLRFFYVCLVAIGVVLFAAPAQTQLLVVRHPLVPIGIMPNQPSTPPRPAGVRLPVPTTQPAKPVERSTACTPTGQPAPIIAIVKALNCDPDLIFEYVYNNIEFDPLYGSIKGPLGTLLDQRGGDADQAMLLVTLLSTAGYASQTQFAWAVIRLTGAQLSNWLGVTNDAAAIEELLLSGYIPTANYTLNPDGTLNYIDLGHFAVSLELSGTTYYFDPSYKQHAIVSGLPNLASALGYSRSQFLADAGGSVDSISIANVNRAALRDDLTTYANNLVMYINQNNRTWSIGNIIGGKTIQPLSGSPIRQTSFPNISPAFPDSETTFAAFPTDCPLEGYTAECRTYTTVTMPGASPSQAIKLYTDQIYGHRITVFSVPSGNDYVPTLLIDGAVPSCVTAGTCTNVGTPEPAGTSWSIPVTVVEANQNPGETTSCGTGITACKTLAIAAGGSYLISTGAGRVGRGMPQYHRQLLAQARAAGNADTSELVLGESLAVLGYTWLAEFSAEQQITDQLVGTTTIYQFGVGITGQANINQSGYQGPYIDLPLNEVNVLPQVSNGPTTTIGGNTYPTAVISAFFSDAEALSALESAVLEQTQAPVSGMTAASTVQIVDANMNPSYSGALQTTYFADGTTCAGQTAFVNTIEPAISSYYGASDYDTIVSAVMGGSSNCPGSPPTGAQVLIPQNGQLAVGLWTGAGYTEIFPQSSDVIAITQKITGGLSGGFSGVSIIDPTDNFQITLPPPASTDTVTPLLNATSGSSNPQTTEPIDSITGAYIYTNNDLTTGSGQFPYALPFSRTYLSSSGSYLSTTTADVGMGNGWMHNYDVNAQIQSDPYTGMGPSDSPAISGATSIVALYVMQDLLSVTPTPQTMTISSMAARWFTDQLTSNVVMVQQPNTTEEFVALPHADGSVAYPYNPPPGSSVQFDQTAAGRYTYTRKDGVTLNFGPTPTGALQNWTFPNGMSVNLTYSGSQLTGISNNLGRHLSLSYSGSDIGTVTDDTGRTVSYGYDNNHNLTSAIDPLRTTTTYAYDASGTYDTAAHLTQVFYPALPQTPFVTNWYDPLGRIDQQANANGAATNLYFAGSRSEIVDPLGNQHVTYQTDRGKVLSDAWVLNPSGIADVFNDTSTIPGVVNVTTHQYDGIDRLTLTTLPEGGSSAYSYVVNLNPWANNIGSITDTAKPGSTLSPLTTTITYDPIYNKPTSVTDPLGLVTLMSYDPATGNLLRDTADAGAAPHYNATTRLTYDAHGKVLTSTDPLGVLTTFAYDSFENLITSIGDAGTGHLNVTTRYGYDTVGDVVRTTDPNGNTATRSYDADRRLLTTIGPWPFNSGLLLVETTNTYDANGQLLRVQRSLGTSSTTTSSTYTPSGRVATATDANGDITRYAYDADDRLASATDPVGRVTTFAYDALSRNISIGNPAFTAPLAQFAYTPDGLAQDLTDANSNTTDFAYDGFDRLSTTTFPDSSTETLTYDADSNVLTRQTRRGDTIGFAYDTLSRVCTKTYATSPVACGGSSSNYLASYAYDLDGRLIAASDNSSAIESPTGTSVQYAASLAYDQLNRPLTVSWNPAPVQTAPASSSSTTFGYGYDRSNRRITQSATDNSWWSYPASAGSTAYTANNLNQYTAVGSVSPTYDGNGNLTYDGTFTYGYDAENRLVSITQASNPVASYSYDAQGRRKIKTVGSTTTLYVTDADNHEVLEYDGTSGALGRWYAYGIGPDAVLDQMNIAAGTRETMIPDIQGSIVAMLDSGSATLLKTGYQPYGENPSLTSAGTYQYTARRFDPETAGSTAEPSGLYYYRTRQYSPTLGRFLQADSIGYAGGNNLYTYVGNDPLNATDPSGLQEIPPDAMTHILNSHGIDTPRTRPGNSVFNQEYSNPTALQELSNQVFASPLAPPAPFYGGMMRYQGQVLLQNQDTGQTQPYMIGTDKNGNPTNQVEIRYLPNSNDPTQQTGPVVTMFPVPMSNPQSSSANPGPTVTPVSASGGLLPAQGGSAPASSSMK